MNEKKCLWKPNIISSDNMINTNSSGLPNLVFAIHPETTLLLLSDFMAICQAAVETCQFRRMQRPGRQCRPYTCCHGCRENTRNPKSQKGKRIPLSSFHTALKSWTHRPVWEGLSWRCLQDPRLPPNPTLSSQDQLCCDLPPFLTGRWNATDDGCIFLHCFTCSKWNHMLHRTAFVCNWKHMQGRVKSEAGPTQPAGLPSLGPACLPFPPPSEPGVPHFGPGQVGGHRAEPEISYCMNWPGIICQIHFNGTTVSCVLRVF